MWQNSEDKSPSDWISRLLHRTTNATAHTAAYRATQPRPGVRIHSGTVLASVAVLVNQCSVSSGDLCCRRASDSTILPVLLLKLIVTVRSCFETVASNDSMRTERYPNRTVSQAPEVDGARICSVVPIPTGSHLLTTVCDFVFGPVRKPSCSGVDKDQNFESFVNAEIRAGSWTF